MKKGSIPIKAIKITELPEKKIIDARENKENMENKSTEIVERITSWWASPAKISTTDDPQMTDVVQAPKDYGKLSCLIIGMLIGTFLNPFTLIVMVCLGILVDNRQLPTAMGGLTPQEIVMGLLRYLLSSTATIATKALRHGNQ